MKRPDYQERRTAERAANMAALCAPSRSLHRGTYAGSTSVPAPKTEAYRDAALLEMARGRPCLLLVPAVCNHRTDTTVACHSNLSIHGKAAARKADDQYSCWGCAACHAWLDQSRVDGVIKEMAFMQAHLLQVLAWRQIATDTTEPERFRRAARRALEPVWGADTRRQINAAGLWPAPLPQWEEEHRSFSA